ncbi:type 1 glutamine amidotransferase [Patescibacteria group bacterium]|nr:type 1 glutamine amidotransferase [Patescibacteria group bacterium]
MLLKNKTVAIFVEQMYQVLEVWYPYYRLTEEGADVFLVGPKQGEVYLSKEGYPAKADKSIEDLTAADFDAVIIPGGFAPDYMRRTKAFIDFVKELNADEKVIATICHGAWIAASAEVVEGKKMTCFWPIKDDIIHAGANYVDEQVVQDKNLISSRTPDDLPAFCKTIINSLT